MKYQNDLPLRKDIAARFVPKIVGLMAYLGSLCFVFTLFMFHATQLWEKQLTTDISIEIPTFSVQSSQVLESRVLSVLNGMQGIREAKVIPQGEITQIFQSLVGETISPDVVSLPVIIDVSFSGKEAIDLHSLKARLQNISPHIQIVNHREWQSQVSNLIQTGVLLSLLISCLILFAAVATTTFATNTGLLIHRQIIEVLSLIGATNSYIAKQFQYNALRQGLFSGAIGAFFAFLTFLFITFLFESAGFTFVMDTSFFFQAMSIFILFPFCTAILMMGAARLAVMKVLCQ